MFHYGQTVVLTDAFTPPFSEHPMELPAGTVGMVKGFATEGDANIYFVEIYYQHPNGYHVTTVNGMADSQIRSFYGSYQRPLSPNNLRMVNVAFKAAKINRGKSVIAAILDIIGSYKAVIAGGYAAWALAPLSFEKTPGEIIHPFYNDRKDLDIFCCRADHCAPLIEAFTIAGFEIEDDNPFVVTLRPTEDLFEMGCPIVQIVRPILVLNGTRFGTPEQIIDGFDFAACRAVIVSKIEGVVDVDFEEDMVRQRLTFKNIGDPLREMGRVRRYCSNGFSISLYQEFLLAEAVRLFPYDANQYGQQEQRLLAAQERQYANQVAGVTDSEWGIQSYDSDDDLTLFAPIAPFGFETTITLSDKQLAQWAQMGRAINEQIYERDGYEVDPYTSNGDEHIPY